MPKVGVELEFAGLPNMLVDMIAEPEVKEYGVLLAVLISALRLVSLEQASRVFDAMQSRAGSNQAKLDSLKWKEGGEPSISIML